MKYLKFDTSERDVLFYKTLKDRAIQAINQKNIGFGNFNFWFKGIFWVAVTYLCYLALFSENISGLQFWFLFLGFQLAGLLVGFSLGHDASHQTAFKNKKLNGILHFFSFITIGIDPVLWGLRHLRSHHVYANIEGSDVDIDKNPFLRLSPTHPWQPKHRFQVYYAPLVYQLALLHSVFMSDWIYLFSKDYHWMRKGKSNLFLRFIIFKVVYFLLVLVLPMLFTKFSIGFIVFTYVTASAFTSLLFVIMLVGTHFFLEADYPITENTETLENSWHVHQLKTSCDWNANNSWARFLSGGSNCHAAHHLFPNVCHVHYKKINPIIAQTTQEFQLPYHHKSLWEMMSSHFKHLKKMGEITT
jgi:linoleoyl-CoA desaturase